MFLKNVTDFYFELAANTKLNPKDEISIHSNQIVIQNYNQTNLYAYNSSFDSIDAGASSSSSSSSSSSTDQFSTYIDCYPPVVGPIIGSDGITAAFATNNCNIFYETALNNNEQTFTTTGTTGIIYPGNGGTDVGVGGEPPDFTKYMESLSKDRVGLLIFLCLFSFATVFGNSLVILAVIRERYLHTSTNLFVTSLAVADCLVGLVVMPFSALYEVLENTWFFGTDWCDIWRSLDVLFSTASILNLCVISLDRYWAITDPLSYPMRMTRRRAAGLICVVWICSSAISFPAILWWRAAREGEMPAYKCTFTEHLGYLVFSSTISFYLPLLVMVFTYCRIYRAAVIQTRSLKIGTKQVLMASGELQLTLRIHRGGTTRAPSHHDTSINSSTRHQHHQHHRNSAAAAAAAVAAHRRQQQLQQHRKSQQQQQQFHLQQPHQPHQQQHQQQQQQQQQQQLQQSSLSDDIEIEPALGRTLSSTSTNGANGCNNGGAGGGGSGGGGGGTTTSTPDEQEDEPLSALHNNGLGRHRHIGHKNFSLSRKLAKFAKEKKAAKTLGIVMGVFIVCWLPFFVVNLLSGFCIQCIAHEEIVSAVVTWLGWINSSMNPVIYACWSRDFRRAFVRILCVCCPRKIRRKYQPTMRSKSQRFATRRCYSSCSLHGIQHLRQNSCEQTYI